MKLLIDTHVLLWWLDDPALLSKDARSAIQNGRNTIYVSAAVTWEIMIKQSLGKLKMPDTLDQVLKVNRFSELSITVPHTLTLQTLPVHHRDPFDRILVAQALCEELTIISRDANIQKYSVAYLLA